MVEATETLGLAVMEIKENIFLNKTQFRHSNRCNGLISSQSKEGNITKAKICGDR